MIDHPMETGRRRDEASGQLVPTHFITNMDVLLNDKRIIEGVLSTAVSKNPYFSFELEGIRQGDTIKVIWRDNLGFTDEGFIRINNDEP